MSCPPIDRPDWPFDVAHTEAELAEMRRAVLLDFKEQLGIDSFTCDTCELRYKCDLVFEPYNTDGDCLADK